jgi:CheY-like chemotaxis protein
MTTGKKKILLVDDSKTSIFLERMILKDSYDLVTAMDGEEAVRTAEAELPDLILMDVVMPRMTGFEAVREIRRRQLAGDVPIIMVTTRSEAGSMQTGFESGCTDYVTKPIDADELLFKVGSLLSA